MTRDQLPKPTETTPIVNRPTVTFPGTPTDNIESEISPSTKTPKPIGPRGRRNRLVRQRQNVSEGYYTIPFRRSPIDIPSDSRNDSVTSVNASFQRLRSAIETLDENQQFIMMNDPELASSIERVLAAANASNPPEDPSNQTFLDRLDHME